MILIGDKTILKPIEWDDITEVNKREYVDNLNDMETMKYAGMAKLSCHTIDTVRNWINELNENQNQRLLGIYDVEHNTLLGNIRIDIDWTWKVGRISIWICKFNHSKGYGNESIRLITDFAFNDLGMEKIEAGILEGNISSIRAFEKSGFEKEGIRKSRRFHEGKRVNEILMGKVKEV